MFDRKKYNREYGKIYRKKHSDELNRKRRKDYLEESGKYIDYAKTAFKYKKKHRNHQHKWRTDSKYRLNHIMGNSMRDLLKGKKNGRKWQDLVPYSLNDLIKRLKKTMPVNYTWQDFLEGKLHVDHIIPISAFEFEEPTDFQFHECWALNNLRLLPAKENLIKGSKIIKSYQLALKV